MPVIAYADFVNTFLFIATGKTVFSNMASSRQLHEIFFVVLRVIVSTRQVDHVQSKAQNQSRLI